MSIADALACISYFIGSPTTGTAACVVQGIGEQWFQLSSIIWTTIISYTLWNAVINRKDSAKLMPYYLAVGYGVPFLTSMIPLFTDSYVNTGFWCWFDASTTEGTVLRFLFFYFPLWSAIIFNAWTYYVTITTMKNILMTQETSDKSSDIPNKYKKLIARLKLYPLVLVICWFWGTINRLQNAISPSHPQFWLFLLQVLGSHSQGWMNAVVYGLNPGVREAWVGWLEEVPRLRWLAAAIRTKEASDDHRGDEEDGDPEDDRKLVDEDHSRL